MYHVNEGSRRWKWKAAIMRLSSYSFSPCKVAIFLKSSKMLVCYLVGITFWWQMWDRYILWNGKNNFSFSAVDWRKGSLCESEVLVSSESEISFCLKNESSKSDFDSGDVSINWVRVVALCMTIHTTHLGETILTCTLNQLINYHSENDLIEKCKYMYQLSETNLTDLELYW